MKDKVIDKIQDKKTKYSLLYKILCISILFLTQTSTVYSSSVVCEKVPAPRNLSNNRPTNRPKSTRQEIIDSAPSNAPVNNPSQFSDCTPVRSIFIPRSQGADTVRELIGWQSLLYGYNALLPVVFNQTLEFSRSFSPELINYYLFNRDNRLTFSGSLSDQRKETDLLADYFGLSPYFQGDLFLDPRIENIYFDNQLFFRLDHIACGLYGKIFLPLVHTRWSLGLQQEIFENQGDFPQGYMSPTQVPPFQTIERAVNYPNNYGSSVAPLEYGLLDFDTRTLTRLADIDLILGYNVVQQPYYHFGLYLQGVVPTGNKPSPRYLFNPIVGNAKHGELGVGITAHRLVWTIPRQGYISLYLEGNVCHMFSNNQLRSFDLEHQGALSRYMLLKEFESDGKTPTGRFVPAINLTTLPVKSKVDVKADFAIKLAYNDPCGLEVDLGYNIYGNKPEDIEICSPNNTTTNNNTYRYGVKGTQGTNYLVYDTQGSGSDRTFGNIIDTPVLNSTENNALISDSGNIDNPETIQTDNNSTLAVTWNSAQTGDTSASDVIRAQSSNPPVLLPRDIRKAVSCSSGAACGSLTHAVFFYVNHIKHDFICKNWISNLGIGAKVEFQGYVASDRHVVDGQVFEAEIIDRLLSSLNQWCIYLKGGISF